MKITKATAVSKLSCPTCEYGPEKLIDGNDDTFYLSDDPIWVQDPPKPLWVQLEVQSALVDRIEIKNRKDGLGDRTSQVEVRVGNSKLHPMDLISVQNELLQKNHICGEWPQTGQDGELIIISCGTQLQGSLITVVIKDPRVKQINMAEIRIFRKV